MESLAAGCKGKLVRRYLHKNAWKRNGSEKRTPEKEVAQKGGSKRDEKRYVNV